MPELPEIETICQDLKQCLLNEKIVKLHVINNKLRFPVPQNLISITNNKIINIKRQGKYIIFILNNNITMLVHLGMSGKLIYKSTIKQYNVDKHSHIIWTMEQNQVLILHDTRKFSIVSLSTKQNLKHHKLLKNIGIEPLSNKFDNQMMQTITKNKKTTIKNLLMNAKYIAGIGNIYASEILFNAKISPFKPSKELTIQENHTLVRSIKFILRKAISYRGSSLKDYKKIDGTLGNFQNYFQVYNQKGKPCNNCNNIIKKIKQNNRSTYYCEKCQT